MSETEGDDEDIVLQSDGAWVLLEDGSIRYVPHEESEPELRTDENGEVWLQLDSDIPIYPTVIEVAVENGVPVWPEAPKYEARQWQAKPKVKPVSLFTAIAILLKNQLTKPDEIKQQLEDIHGLIRGGHAERALSRLQQFEQDFRDSRAKTTGLKSLAYHALNQTELAEKYHIEAYFLGNAHEAMLEIYGYPDIAEHFGASTVEDEAWDEND